MHIIPEMPVPPIIDGHIVSKKTGDVITMTAYLKEVYQEHQNQDAQKMLSDMKAKIERDTGISIEIKSSHRISDSVKLSNTSEIIELT